MAFIDDDPSLVGRSIAGLPVYSSRQVPTMLDKTGVKEVFMAIPSATWAERQEILSNLARFPVHVRSIPGIVDIASGKVKVDDLQELHVADRQVREPVPSGDDRFRRCTRKRELMLPSAGGSIGS